MSEQRTTFYVDGMTCSACESRISKTLSGLAGVTRFEVRLSGGSVTVEYDDSIIDLSAIQDAIVKTGYAVRSRRGSGTALALGIGLLLVAAYLVAGSSGLFASIPKIDASIGYAMLFVIGLLTSIHCVAMCGGIALSQSVGIGGGNGKEGCSLSGSRARQFVPGLLYNAGRVVSYTVIGGAVGAIGSAFSFSPAVKGIIAGIAGLFMIVLGLRMLGLLKSVPHLSGFVPEPIRRVGATVATRLRNGGPFAVGVLNGLMPCGPLQTMQLYALGTGSAFYGALSMLIFSLGTVPLMLVFGVTAALLPRKFVPVMVKASAVLVMFLGVVTFARAATLAGVTVPRANQSISVSAGLPKATVSGNVQTIVTEFKGGRYIPFAVQAGVPLKWTIRITADEITGCNGELVVPEYGIRKKLIPGDNLVEFTPKNAGTISYSCWMGMIRSSITVAESLGSPVVLSSPGDSDQVSPVCSCCSQR